MSSSGLDSWGNRPKPSEWFGNLPKVIDGSAGKESACSAGDRRDTSSIPGLGRSPGGEHGNPLQYSYLENAMDRGPWWTAVHRIHKE